MMNDLRLIYCNKNDKREYIKEIQKLGKEGFEVYGQTCIIDSETTLVTMVRRTLYTRNNNDYITTDISRPCFK